MIMCITTINGTIIPIHQIAKIAGQTSSHYIWTSADSEGSDGHKLNDAEYNKLLNELEIL